MTTLAPPHARLTDGRLLARNALGNLASQATPMALAVLTMPLLVRGLGTERFGVLTLAWVLLGYFSLFDLGLGRALTKLVAEVLGRGEERDVPALVTMALALMLALGVAGALLIGLLTPWLVGTALKIPGPLRDEARWSLLSDGRRAAVPDWHLGIAGRSRIVSAADPCQPRADGGRLRPAPRAARRAPLDAPPGGRARGGRRRPDHVVLPPPGDLSRCHPQPEGGSGAAPALVRPLLNFGGWMTVANVVNPIMVQMDRFLIGALASSAAVAYYTTPYGLVTKYWFLSNAVLGVIFPAFATSYARDRAATARIFGRGVKYVFLILAALTVATVVLAPEILRLWLGDEFAAQSSGVMRLPGDRGPPERPGARPLGLAARGGPARPDGACST